MSDELVEMAVMGTRAIEDGDTGRSKYLVEECGRALSELTLQELEWLSVAVSNAALERYIAEQDPPEVVADADGVKTEVWDI